MEKRFFIFIIISFAIIFSANYFFIDKSKKPQKSYDIEEKKEENNDKTVKSKENIENLSNKTEEVDLENEFIDIKAITLGARIKNIFIKKIDDFKNISSENIDLIDQLDSNKNLSLKIKIDNQTIDLSSVYWNYKKSEKSIIFTTEPIKNIIINKEIIINNDFSGSIVIRITNNTNNKIELEKPTLTWGPGKNSGKSQFNTKQIVVLNENKIERIKTKKRDETTQISIQRGWAAMSDQYFCSIFYSDPGKINAAEISQNSDQTLNLSLIFPNSEIKEKEYKIYDILFYFGPQNYRKLTKSGYFLNKIVNFGIFKIIGIPIYYILIFLFKITKNYGVSIILLTILIRGILWWPTQKSYSSMKKMQTAMNKMQPRLKTLKEIYRDNPQKLNEETMKLYKEYQINPMGGCLPMLLQMPIFFALYAALIAAVELKGANFFWIWKDLSTRDSYFILPVLMGLSMFVQQKMSTPPASTAEAATQQKMMLYIMPIMLTVFAFSWPSGLLLYWVVSNLLSIGQQVLINRKS